ncbi:MAG: NAD(P)-dependent alcohol dehydrogenase [Chloroflexi bacterium]|nr:MAG: NAD(P)-dependent alcohol dehydrogenase [Chloroflexota bacterium]
MKAIVCRKPGRPDVLELEGIDTPSFAEDGLLVKVRASSINPVDFFSLSRVGFTASRVSGGFRRKPVVLGTDFAGRVESVGNRVTEFKPGDEVFGGRSGGAFAEYLSVPANGAVVHKSASLSFNQAAALPVAAVTALQAVRDHGKVREGQKVVINGASGGVGSFAVQIAKAFGAHVTAVCSPRNVETARRLGADRLIDYTREDFTLSGSYEVIVDVAGNHSWSEYKRVLTPTGIMVAAGGSAHTVWGTNRTIKHLIGVRMASLRSTQKAALFIAKLNKADLLVLQRLLVEGKITPVIDRCYELNRVPDAFDYMGEGHAKGKIIINV